MHAPASANITALLTGGIAAAGLTHGVLCAPSLIPYHGCCTVRIYENASACNCENDAALWKVLLLRSSGQLPRKTVWCH